MLYGLVDIGSNTIRGVVYDIKGKKYKKMLSERDYAEIISYIMNNRLMEEGIQRLCQTITKMKLIFELVDCQEVEYFATSSLRGIANSKEVMGRIRKETGVEIRVISGEQEAYYDYISLKNYLSETRALGLDLGGGSGQLFYYEKNKLVQSASYRIGCLRLYQNLVEGLLPTKQERRQIVKSVQDQVAQGPAFAFYDMETLYVMGGTGRAMAKLHSQLGGSNKMEFPYMIPVQDFHEMKEFQETGGLSGLKMINKLFPERLCSIIPGTLAIITIAEMLGVKKIGILKEGVREGYLLENVIRRGDKK